MPLPRKSVVPIALLLLSCAARADLVGTYVEDITKHEALVFELSSQQRAATDHTAADCAKTGRYMVLVSHTTSQSFPRLSRHAAGCWSYSNGGVHIEAYTKRDEPLTRRFPASGFVTPQDFKGWSVYERREPSQGQAAARVSRFDVDRRPVPIKTFKTQYGDMVITVTPCPDKFGGDGFALTLVAEEGKREMRGCWLHIEDVVTITWREVQNGGIVTEIFEQRDYDIADFYR